MTSIIPHLSFILVFVSATCAFKEQPRTDWWKATQAELKRALKVRPNMGVAKNVILFMGDGMGLSNIMASRVYQAQTRDKSFAEALLTFEKFPYVGLSRTYNADRMVTDSAAAAGAYLCGQKIRTGTIGISQDAIRGRCGDVKGNELTSILKHSYRGGKWTGVITDARLTHASPANAYANCPDRAWESDVDMPAEARNVCKDIAKQLIEDNDFIRVLMGGGRGMFTSDTLTDPEYPDKQGRRLDGRDLLKEWVDKKRRDNVKARYVRNMDEFNDADESSLDYLLGVFEPDHMHYEVDRTNTSKNKWPEPSLSDMVEKSIRMLRRSDKGYFLFVEGGRIDHGHHATNAFRALNNTVAFSDAIQRALEVTKGEKDETLIVVTADHSHAFTVGGLTPINNPILGLAQKIVDGTKIELDMGQDGMPFTVLSYANGPGYYPHHTNGTHPIRGRKNLTADHDSGAIYSIDYLQEAPVPLKDETHGGEDVAIYATGPMAHLFHGSHEETFIAHVILYASCVGPNQEHCNNPRYEPWPGNNKDGSSSAGNLFTSTLLVLLCGLHLINLL